MCFKTLSVWNCMLKSMQKINFMVNLCRCHLFLRNTIIVLFLKFITPKCHVNYLMFFRDIYMYLKYESLIVPLDWDLFKIGGWKRDWREDSTFYHGYISKGHLESSDGGNSCRTYPLDLPLSLYHSLFLYVQLNKQLSHIYMYLFMYYLIFISIFFNLKYLTSNIHANRHCTIFISIEMMSLQLNSPSFFPLDVYMYMCFLYLNKLLYDICNLF